MSERWRASWPLFLGILVFSLYLATLAPTVLWGDDAYFQRTAFTGELRPDGGGHWLWLQAARVFARLFPNNVAYGVNLLSAIAAALTVSLVYATGRAAGLSVGGSAAAALSLAVAHTFWTHAVRAEVYTVFTAVASLQLWLWFSWRQGKNWPLYAAALGFGVALLAHQLALLLLPPFGHLVWRRRRWLHARHWFILGVALVAGLLPFCYVIYRQIAVPLETSLISSLSLYFTQAGADFSDALFGFSSARIVRDVLLWLALLGLQFVGIAGLLGLFGLIDRARHGWPIPWLTVAVLYAVSVLFAISYRVNDQFVFYLPSYLAFALFVGAGWDGITRALNQYRPWLAPILLSLIILIPTLTYAILPPLVREADIDPLGVRTLPGREPTRFFLWPPKNGDRGAADFAWEALSSLPPGAVLIADHTPLEPLRYMQTVEGLRPDINLVKIEPGQPLGPVLARQNDDAPLFVADDNPDYYSLEGILGARLVRRGNVFRVLLPD